MSVSVCAFYFKDSIAQFKDRNVERSTTQIINGNFDIAIQFVQTVGQGGSGRLVDDTLNHQTCDFTGFFGCLTLCIVKVCGYGDYGAGYFLTQIIFGGFLHFLKYHSADFLGGVVAITNLNTGSVVVALYHFVRYASNFNRHVREFLAHETFDRLYGVLGVCDGLTFGGVSNLAFAISIVHKCHNGGGSSASFAVGNYNGFVAFQYGYAAVCSS